MPQSLIHCPCCGLIQRLPAMPQHSRALCQRCHTPLSTHTNLSNRLSEALALTALILYPAAMLLPMLRLERLGHSHEDSLLSGLIALFAEGHYFVGAVVLLFSVVLPPLKLLALWWLCAMQSSQAPRQAFVYRWVEHLGRWGMLDVMLVAILVAFVKLGDLVNIHAGYGLFAFALMVLLSLLASLWFNPRALWSDQSASGTLK